MNLYKKTPVYTEPNFTAQKGFGLERYIENRIQRCKLYHTSLFYFGSNIVKLKVHCPIFHTLLYTNLKNFWTSVLLKVKKKKLSITSHNILVHKISTIAIQEHEIWFLASILDRSYNKKSLFASYRQKKINYIQSLKFLVVIIHNSKTCP